MKFRSKGPNAIYLPRAGVKVQFVDGVYETDDEREIEALNKSRHAEAVTSGDVIKSKETSAQTQSKDEPLSEAAQKLKDEFETTEGAGEENGIDPDHYTRDELNSLAERHGIENPERFGNKQEVADAINDAE